jgi:hypothetical protein
MWRILADIDLRASVECFTSRCFYLRTGLYCIAAQGARFDEKPGTRFLTMPLPFRWIRPAQPFVRSLMANVD